MDLLTNRLSMMAEQIYENHMAELIDNERVELERFQHYRPCRGTPFRSIATQNQVPISKFGNLAKIRSSLSKNKKEGNKKNKHEDEQKNQDDVPKITAITTVCDIWGLSKKNKNESNQSSKENTAPKPNLSKFRRVARTTVLLESLKKGHDICTCESLDARCKLHDL